MCQTIAMNFKHAILRQQYGTFLISQKYKVKTVQDYINQIFCVPVVSVGYFDERQMDQHLVYSTESERIDTNQIRKYILINGTLAVFRKHYNMVNVSCFRHNTRHKTKMTIQLVQTLYYRYVIASAIIIHEQAMLRLMIEQFNFCLKSIYDDPNRAYEQEICIHKI